VSELDIMNIFYIGFFLIAVPVSTAYIIYRYIRTAKCNIIITKDYGDMRRIIYEKKRYPIKNNTFEYDKRSYVLDMSKAILDRNNKPILFFDYEKSEPIKMQNNSESSSRVFNMILKDNTINKLLTSYKDKMFTIIIIALAIGIVALGLFSIYTISNMNNRIAELLAQTSG